MVSGIGSWLRNRWPEILWAFWVVANLFVVARIADWETIPFHFVWVSLTIAFGVRLWSFRATVIAAVVVTLTSGAALLMAVQKPGGPGLDEMAEVPLMAAMFAGMVWHAQRRQAAIDEVGRLVDRQRGLLERQREFVSDASHQLRTPVTIARGHAELIRDALLTGGTAEAIGDMDILLDELGRLSRLSERLLILAAADHPRMLATERVDLSRFIRSCSQRWRRTARRRWSFEAEAKGSITADAERLEMAIDALIENAVKFTQEGDGITVRATADGGSLAIEVSDTGVGISENEIDRVFERFASGEAAGPGRRGTGLGLAIVRAIVQAHGGSVGATSEPGRGSTFRIRLPGFQAAAEPAVVDLAELEARTASPADRLAASDR